MENINMEMFNTSSDAINLRNVLNIENKENEVKNISYSFNLFGKGNITQNINSLLFGKYN
jgi:hypothetical protein